MKKSILFWILFLVFVLWQAIGLFPLFNYEGDGVSLTNDVENALINGSEFVGKQGYGYFIAPGTFWLLFAIAKIFSIADVDVFFCIITFCCVIVWQYFVIKLVSKLSGVGSLVALGALVLIPESFMLSMYGNSTALPLLMVTIAFLLAAKGKVWTPLILMAIAPVLRLDIMIIYPALPLLWTFSGKKFLKSILFAAFYGILIALFVYGAYIIMDTNTSTAVTEFDSWGNKLRLTQNIGAICGFYGITGVIFTITGIFVLIKNKNYMLGGIIVGMMLLVHGVLLRFGNASKHFVVLMPFVASAVAVAIVWIWQQKVFVKSIACAVVAFYAFFSFKIPEIYKHGGLNPYVPSVTLADIKGFKVGLGGGIGYMTADEAVLISGNIVYSFTVHNLKVKTLENYEHFLEDARKYGTSKHYLIYGWFDHEKAQQGNLRYFGDKLKMDTDPQIITECYYKPNTLLYSLGPMHIDFKFFKEELDAKKPI